MNSSVSPPPNIYPPVDPPKITYHPSDQLNVLPGSTVRFTVTATGGGTLTYKWQRNGADLDTLSKGVSGETTSTLQIDNVRKKHEGTYTCIVSNAAGATPSNPTQLTVRKFLCIVEIATCSLNIVASSYITLRNFSK